MEVILTTNYVSVRHGMIPLLRSKLRQERLAFLETHLPGMKEARLLHGELQSHLGETPPVKTQHIFLLGR